MSSKRIRAMAELIDQIESMASESLHYIGRDQRQTVEEIAEEIREYRKNFQAEKPKAQ